MHRILIVVFFIFSIFTIQAQVTDFVDQTTLCLGEELDLSSLDSQLTGYAVDYCLGEFGSAPLDEGLASFSDNFRLSGADMIYDTANNTYHLFMVDNSFNSLKRIDFGDTLTRTFVENTITLSGSTLDRPSEIKVVKDENGLWYGFIGTTGTNVGIKRVDFGTDLATNNAVLTDLGSFGQVNSIYRSVSVRKEGSKNFLIGLLQNSNRFVVVDYANSFSNTPSDTLVTSPLPNVNNAIGFDLVRYNGDVIVYAVGLSSRNIVRANFGVSVFSDFVFENNYDQTDFPSISSSLSRINIQESFGEYYAAITPFSSGNTFFVDLKNLDNSQQPEELGYTISLYTDLAGGYYEGRYIYYGVTRRNLGIIEFDSDCGASISYQENPLVPVSYDKPGVYNLGLIGADGGGNVTNIRDTLEVLNETAPDIDFTIDDNACVEADNTFTAINVSGDIIAYSWDFDGDGTPDSSDPNPIYSFATPGEYDVILSVSNAAGCSNSVSRSVTIYPAPLQPADFQVTSAGPFCSNSVLNFSYDPEPELSGIASFLWDFNGEETSTEQNPDFAFDSPGSKTVGLTVSIPGCTTTVYSEVIEILTGPDASFDYSNNCFGEPIQFQNLTTGTGNLSYQWDFGDGVGASNEENPAYEYTSGGIYTVSLSVTNASGCITVYSEVITINDQPLASITAGEAIENLPVSFSGIDETLSGDSVIDWQWNFARLGTAGVQDTAFTFSDPGDYSIILTVNTANGCTDTIEAILSVSASEKATPSFELDDIYCRNERFRINNTSVNASSYFWDLCLGEFITEPTIENLGSFSDNFRIDGLDLVYDTANDSFHLFFTDNSLNTLKRIDLGDSLGTSFTQTQIVFTEGALVSPTEIEIVQEEDGSWYAFVGSSQAGVGVRRINLGSSIGADTATISEIGTFGQGNVQIRGLELISQNGTDYLMALGFENENLIIAEYANGYAADVTDTIVLPVIDGIVNARGFDLIEINNELIALVGGQSSRSIVRLNFGSDITTGYTIENTYTEDDFSSELISLSDIHIVESFGKYYGLVSRSGSAPTIIMDLEDLNNAFRPVELSYTLPELSDLDGIYYEGNYYYYGVGRRSLEYIAFTSECSSEQGISTEMSPQLSFSDEETVPIGLIAFHRSGTASTLVDTIRISADVAPDIDIIPGENRCLDAPVQFTVLNESNDITAYEWDFDNDGVIDSTEPQPGFQFTTAGTYQVRLNVASAGCENYTSQEITIYPAPATSSFSINGESFCLGDEVTFMNTSVETGLEGVISYIWNFDGEAESSDKNPVFTFNTSGVKTIGLQSVIPGCTTTVVTREIIVNDPPQLDFDFTRVCEGQPTEFFDISISNNLELFAWDFGDGFTSNVRNPQRIFAAEGIYPVTFEATDENGCISSITKQVIVGQIPEPDFTITGDLACSATELQFNDVTDNSAFNITSRNWQINGVDTASTSDPRFTFSEAGDYTISLTVENDFGCSATIDSLVSVSPSPQASLEVQTACIGSPTVFFDRTDVSVRSWFWVIDGQEYVEQNPSVIFEEAGVYEVSLEVTSENFCVGTISSTFEILPIPEADFDFSSDCAGQQIRFEDISTVFSDQVVSRTWSFGDGTSSNGIVAFHTYPSAGTYPVTLTLLTENGCISTHRQTIEVNPSPSSAFTVARDFGVPPFDVEVMDLAENAIRRDWFLNDVFLAVDNQFNPTIPIQEPGIYTLKQVVSNEFGCRDSSEVNIVSDIPAYDLELTDFEVITENGISSFVISVVNNSNLPVADFNVNVSLDNRFILSEKYRGVVRRGDQIVYTLNTTVPEQNLGFVCIEIAPVGIDYIDIDNADNEDCRNFNNNINISEAYPNPAEEQVMIDVVFDTPEPFGFFITDVLGNIVYSQAFSESDGKLQKIIIDMSIYRKGIYFAVFEMQGEKIVRRILKN